MSRRDLGFLLARIVLGFIALFTLYFSYVRKSLPYENGKFFDAETGVVYHEQTAELIVVAGGLLVILFTLLVLYSRAAKKFRK